MPLTNVNRNRELISQGTSAYLQPCYYLSSIIGILHSHKLANNIFRHEVTEHKIE
jgi:hypothetical protein